VNLSKRQHTGILVCLFTICFSSAIAEILNVPDDFDTIREAIDASQPTDTVIISRGEYSEAIELSDKVLTIASRYILTNDTIDIHETILLVEGGENILSIVNADLSSIIGLTFRNGYYGILSSSRITAQHNRISDCFDGINFVSGGGGICRYNIIENNFDDAIDLDEDIEIIIEHNRLINNDDEGIEIRLHDFESDSILTCIIRNNVITGNGEDGIQFVDYYSLTNRIFLIERNLIAYNAMVGIGCMGDANTAENYEGAGIDEPIYVINNTIVNNYYGITGGDSLYAINNIISGNEVAGMKNVDARSMISYTVLWDNGINFQECIIDTASMMIADPLFAGLYNGNFYLTEESPCIDAGDPESPRDPDGTRADIGAYYYDRRNFVCERYEHYLHEFLLCHAYPSPFNSTTTIKYSLPHSGFVSLDVYNRLGQRLASLLEGNKQAGDYSVVLNAGDLPSGLYFIRLETSEQALSRRIMLIR